jgi:hypothetical protein
MPCTPIKLSDGTVMIARGRSPRRRCSACGIHWADLACDEPDERHRSGTCDRPLCSGCAVHVEPDNDYCPTHETQQQPLF